MGSIIEGTLVTVEFYMPFNHKEAFERVQAVIDYVNEWPDANMGSGHLMGFAEINAWVDDPEVHFLVADDGTLEDVMRY